MDTRANVQREHIRRGFSIYVLSCSHMSLLLTLLLVSTSHQKVVLEIDFSGSLWGYTEITVVPTSSELKTIHLHSRQCTIQSVTVASHQAEFVHHDPFSNIVMSNAQDCHHHPELKRKIYSALAESDEGELSIAIPQEVPLTQSGNSTTGQVSSEAATPEPHTPGVSSHPAPVVLEFSPIIVNITYSLRNPIDGVQFVCPSDSFPYRVPHAYTTPSSPDAARCWVPCVDNPWEKCTWEFEFIVPRYLEEQDLSHRNDDDESDDVQDASPTIVVCSGELVEQVAHPYNSSKTIFLFSQAILTSVQHIAFAAGPFHLHSIPFDTSADDAPGSSQPLMYAFCLPGHESMLPVSVSTLRSAMGFYTTEFGSYPFGSYKLVFVEELPTQRFDSSTLSLVTVDLLHGEDSLEQAMETRHALGHALACQWVGINIQPKSWSDTWLVNGLGLYITGLFMRKLLGNNEYRFRLKKDMQRVLESDSGTMPPICQPQVIDPPDPAFLPFVNLKSPLVLHILDRRLGKSGTSLGLSRVLPKIFLSAISGEMPNNTLTTTSFLRTCRKVSGVDLRSFAEQWIYGSGCPAFGFAATFNRKKMAVEITMRQEAPAFKALENNELSRTLFKPVPFFEGQMTIRIHEADGTPYEHVLDIRSPFKRYEVPFNTKYKRVRRNTKRYLARQAAAQAAAEGDTEAAEAMGMVDMGFGLEVWEKEKERENWKVADWTEEDEQIMSGATYEWIRMDADFEWIAAIAFDQPDFMWVSQLQRDRDVVAQLEAVYALAKQPTAIVSSTLTKTVLVSNYYFRIRCEAALALVSCAIRRLDFLGLFHLFKLFLRYCYEPEDPNQDLFAHTYVPKPNNFSDISEYFVRKTLVNAISRVRFENGKSPSVVRQFLIDQLRYNDNTANPYSDAFYICTIIAAAACAAVSTTPPERGELLTTEIRTEHNVEDDDLIKQTMAEVDRYRSMDRLIPSYHNVVTIAALDFYLVLTVASLIPSHLRVFFPLTREGNYTQVRTAAFDGLFLTKWYTPQIMRYVLAVMANDPSRFIRRHVARTACQSLALLVSIGELKTSIKESDSLLIEEDGAAPEKNRESMKKSDVDAMIKVLRKDREVGKNEVLREFLLPIALAPDVDHEVRWCVLKLADIVIRGVEETAPKFTIHLPPTPVGESAPQLPLAKVPPKPHRPLKAGGPPSKSPLVPLTGPAKLKLPSAPQVDKPPKVPATPHPDVKRGVTFTVPPPPKDKPKRKPPKPNKATNVPKAQSSGMTLSDLRACQSALKRLKLNKHSVLFMQPVDPIRDHAPNYFDVIKEPMDLSTMTAKLAQGLYKDRFAFQADFRVMINNAKQYNLTGSYAHNEAITLETMFEKAWTRINKTLEAAAAQVPVPVTAPPPSTGKVSSPVTTPLPAPPQDVALASSRPTIKLKVNSTQSKPGPAKPAPKPKGRKPKVVDAPPPPYIDDGSHDILQEVIAIEREKDEERRWRSEKEKISENGISKRKKTNLSDEDDEILAHATPAKKERPSPIDLSVETIARPTPTPTSTPKSGSHKRKEDKPPGSTSSRLSSETPRFSSKGKEREADVVTPKAKKPFAVIPTPINEKKCKDVLKTLLKLPDATIFSRAVDPLLDGCPTYFDEIKHPMDFGTISQKLNDGRYTTMEDFGSDIELVFSNCRQFNPAQTYPVNCADAVERVFKKEWAKATEKKLTWLEKRSLQGVMTALVKEDVSWVFREPVNPELLGIPTYFDVIPLKDARDLKTIRTKLDSDKYESIAAFEADIDLMVRNAIKFNGADSEVGSLATALRSRVSELLANAKAGSDKKRKDGEKSNLPMAKKPKFA